MGCQLRVLVERMWIYRRAVEDLGLKFFGGAALVFPGWSWLVYLLRGWSLWESFGLGERVEGG